MWWKAAVSVSVNHSLCTTSINTYTSFVMHMAIYRYVNDLQIAHLRRWTNVGQNSTKYISAYRLVKCVFCICGL